MIQSCGQFAVYLMIYELKNGIDVISDREEPHQPILLPEHRLSNCRSMDMCSWWRLRRQQGDHTTFDRLHLAQWRSFLFNTTGFLRHDFSQHLYQQLKALKNTTKLSAVLKRQAPPFYYRIWTRSSSHTRLALLLKTNTDSCTRQHSMTCLIAQSLSSLFNNTMQCGCTSLVGCSRSSPETALLQHW